MVRLSRLVQVAIFSTKNFHTLKEFTEAMNKFLKRFSEDEIISVSITNETQSTHGRCIIAYKVSEEDAIKVNKLALELGKNEDEDENEDENDDEDEDDDEDDDDDENSNDELVKIK